MRTSHRQIRKRILDAKSKISDEEFFSSRAYNGYLTDLARRQQNAISGRCVCVLWQTMTMIPWLLRITTHLYQCLQPHHLELTDRLLRSMSLEASMRMSVDTTCSPITAFGTATSANWRRANSTEDA